MAKNKNNAGKKKRFKPQVLPQQKAPVKRPLQLTEKEKFNIKSNFNALSFNQLTPEQQKYYNKIKAGKARAKTAVRYKGVYLSKDIIQLGKKAANAKGISFNKYISNEKALESLYKLQQGEGLTSNMFLLTLNNSLKESKKKFVYINDVETPRKEAMFRLSNFSFELTSSTTTVAIEIKVTVDFSKNFYFKLPPEDFTTDEFDGLEDLREYLKKFGIKIYTSELSE